jgi:hypothetical protein
MSKVNDILAAARRLAEKSETWADLSNPANEGPFGYQLFQE